MARFDGFIKNHEAIIPQDCRIHIASTFATLRHARFHKTMVRVGLAWAGYGLEWMQGGEIISAAQNLRPIVKWKSRIVQIKRTAENTPIGYGSRWTSRRPSVIGLIPVGYADGYPMGLGSTDRDAKSACVGIVPEGRTKPIGFAPVVGAVNMDQITVDLTDVATGSNELSVGTAVELISPDLAAPNHLPKLAKLARTIPHELLCRLNPRLKRVFTSTTTTPESRESTVRPLAISA
jgi:alanine racemase